MGILENIKDIAEVAKKLGNMELYEQIVDLRDQVFALREENLELRHSVKFLTEASTVDAKLKRDCNWYVFADEQDKSASGDRGPFCMTCWDTDRKLINVIHSEGGMFRCGRCSIARGA